MHTCGDAVRLRGSQDGAVTEAANKHGPLQCRGVSSVRWCLPNPAPQCVHICAAQKRPGPSTAGCCSLCCCIQQGTWRRGGCTKRQAHGHGIQLRIWDANHCLTNNHTPSPLQFLLIIKLLWAAERAHMRYTAHTHTQGPRAGAHHVCLPAQRPLSRCCPEPVPTCQPPAGPSSLYRSLHHSPRQQQQLLLLLLLLLPSGLRRHHHLGRTALSSPSLLTTWAP